MTLPTFLVIGCMKGGTTALHRYLGNHPRIFMSDRKELNFFSRYWDQGPAWYAGHFQDAAEPIRGEVSPTYTKAPLYPECPERIAALLPEARLIYLVREPYQRTVSHYKHSVLAGNQTAGFTEALRNQPGLVFTSRYATQLEPYLERFPAERVLVLASEALRSDRERALRRVFDFLGADPDIASADGMDTEHHRTQDKKGSRQWHPRLKSLRSSLAARRVFGAIPAPVRRWLVGAGTRLPDPDETGTLIESIPSEPPADLATIYAQECARLEGMIDASGIPWIGAYRDLPSAVP